MFDSCFPCITPFYYSDLITDISMKAKWKLKEQEKRKVLVNFLNNKKRKRK